MISHVFELARDGKFLDLDPKQKSSLSFLDLRERISVEQAQSILYQANAQDQVSSVNLRQVERLSDMDLRDLTPASSDNPDSPSVIRQALSKDLISKDKAESIFKDQHSYLCEVCSQCFSVRGLYFPDTIECPKGCGPAISVNQAFDADAETIAGPKDTIIDGAVFRHAATDLYETIEEKPSPDIGPSDDTIIDGSPKPNASTNLKEVTESMPLGLIDSANSKFPTQILSPEEASSPLADSFLDSLESFQGAKDPSVLVGLPLGEWTLLELLGKGGMGAVYKAKNDKDQIAAVKVVLPGLSDAKKYLPRFQKEAEVTAQLDHPNIIKSLGYSETPVPHLALEFIDGVDLRKTLNKRRRFPVLECLSIIRSVLDGLAFAHSKGVIHRDLKPENILVSKQGQILLADFGLGRNLNEEEGQRLTLTDHVLGTCYYIAPEQIESSKKAGPEADLYAVGVILFHLLTGQPPFTGSQAKILRSHLLRQPPDIRAWLPELPKRVVQLIKRCMNKNPEDRFRSAAELLEDVKVIEAELTKVKEEALASMIKVQVGEIIDGWLLEKELGSGGMGKVFLASKGKEHAAIKVLAASTTKTGTTLKRFEREIEVMKSLDHPNVVTVLSSGSLNAEGLHYPYMVMELAHKDLSQLVEERGPLPPLEAVEACIGAARGLSIAHSKGIVHRDVKPENILISDPKIREETIRVTDFGVAALANSDQSLTLTNCVIGSPHYMAPEQAHKADARADVYSLGATLYFLLTASRMFAADNLEGLILAHAREIPERADLRYARVPTELAWIVDYAVLKHPNDRPATMAEFIADLEAWKKHELSRTRFNEIKKLVKAGHRPFEKKSAVLTYALMAVLVLALTGIALWQHFQVPKIDHFQGAREQIVSLESKVAKLKTNKNTADRNIDIEDCASRLGALKENLEKLATGVIPVPRELIEKEKTLRIAVDRAAMSFIEKSSRLLVEGDPTGAESDQDAQNVRAVLTSLSRRLTDASEDRRLELEDRMKVVNERLSQIAEARHTAAQIKVFDQTVHSKAYENALSLKVKAGKALEEYGDAHGRKSIFFKNASKRLVETESRRASAYQSILKTVAALEREKSSGKVAFRVFRKRAEAFIKTIPPGNSTLYERTARLVVGEDPELVKARDSLARIKTQIKETNPSAWPYDRLLDGLLELSKSRFKEANEAKALVIKVENARDELAQRLFQKDLIAPQDKKIKSEPLIPADYSAMIQETQNWPKDSRLKGWSKGQQERTARIEQLKGLQRGHGKRLSKRVLTTLRGLGSWQGPAKKYLEQLKVAAKEATSAMSYEDKDPQGIPLVNKKTMKWALGLISYLQASHSKAMVNLKGSRVLLGSNTAPGGGNAALRPFYPKHSRTIGNVFLDQTEVSVGDYQRFLSCVLTLAETDEARESLRSSLTPKNWDSQKTFPKRPVRGVTLANARAFARWSGKRLPTEFEWEYAARSCKSEGGPFAWGSGKPSPSRACFEKDIDSGPVNVDTLKDGRTEEGLFHMSGNVSEWTDSPFKMYPGGNAANFEREKGKYVIRGGNFSSIDLDLYVFQRDRKYPHEASLQVGFRCAKSP